MGTESIKKNQGDILKSFSGIVTRKRFGNDFDLSSSVLSLFALSSVVGLAICIFLWQPQEKKNNPPAKVETLASLRDYLELRLLKLNGKQESIIPMVEGGDIDAKIELLVNEIEQVKGYGEQIDSRIAALDTILTDAIEGSGHGYPLLANMKPEQELVLGGAIARRKVNIKALERAPGIQILRKLNRSEDILKTLDSRIELISRIPSGIPVEGSYSSGFGYRNGRNGRGYFHQGVDLSAPLNSRVQATADGVVVQASDDGDYGLLVRIDHGQGIETIYAHLAKSLVKQGDSVCQGQQIAFSGNSGRSSGPHVHYEVRVDGIAKDPMPFIELTKTLQLVKTTKTVYDR